MISGSAEILFETYNAELEKSYDRYFMEQSKEDLLKNFSMNDDVLNNYLAEGARRWQGSPIVELGGLCPEEYLSTLTNIEDMFELFKVASRICNDDLPAIFLNRLKTFGGAAVEFLLTEASSCTECGEDNINPVQLMAIKALGDWKEQKSITTLINLLFDDSGNKSELLCETVKNALVCIGKGCLEQIVLTIEQAEKLDEPHEYLLIALSDIGSTNRSEAIYKCLKSAFQKMNNKSVGAICIGSYGDGRAIPMLRGYLDRNVGKLDKNTFYEIKAVINRLGGNADDIAFQP